MQNKTLTESVLHYYDLNARQIELLSQKQREIDALQLFLRHCRQETTPQLTPKILDAGCGPGWDLSWFKSQNCEVEGFDGSQKMVELSSKYEVPVWQKDFRFLSLKKEIYDGIWCNRSIHHLPIEETQRVLATFFQALKPRTGVLFISFLEKNDENSTQPVNQPAEFHYSQKAFFSLLRQTGFLLLLQGERKELENKWIATLSKRA